MKRPSGVQRRVLVPYNQQESMSLRTAAKAAGRSESTMRNWCEDHGLGRRIGGIWQVSRVALAMFLDGDGPALSEYHAGNLSSEIVAPYFVRFGIKRDNTKTAKSANSTIAA